VGVFFGYYNDVILIKESNFFELCYGEYKFYVWGVGLVLELIVFGGIDWVVFVKVIVELCCC